MAGLLGKLLRTAAGAIDNSVEQPVFYSALREGLVDHPMESGTGAEWLAQVFEPERTVRSALRDAATNKPVIDELGQPVIETRVVPRSIKLAGVKPAEIKWSGFEDYLNEMKDRPLKRQDLIDFMDGGSGGSNATNSARGMTRYSPVDYSARKGGDEQMSESDWFDEHQSTIDDVQNDIIDRELDDGDWAAESYATSEDVGRFPNRDELIAQLNRLTNSADHYESTGNRMMNGRTLFGEDEFANAAHGDANYYFRNAGYQRQNMIPHQRRLDYVDSMLARDPNTPDLFTGYQDSYLLADELDPVRTEWTAHINDQYGDNLHTFDDVFQTERDALRHAERSAELSDFNDEARQAAEESLREENYGYDRALREVRADYPLSDGGGTEYHDYTIPGGEKYDEQFFNLPEEFTTPRGSTYRQPHWSNQNDEGTRFGHVRWKDRYVDVPGPQIEGGAPVALPASDPAALARAQEDYRATLDAAIRRMEVVRRENPGVNDTRLVEGDQMLTALNANLEHALQKVKDLESNALAPAPRAPAPTVRKKVMAIEESQSDLHQKGRDAGYARDLTPEERVQLDALQQDKIRAYDDMSNARRALNQAYSAYDNMRYDARPNVYSPKYYEHMNELGRRRQEYLGAQTAHDDAQTAASNLDESVRKLADLANGVPDTPFAGTAWTKYAVNRMLRMAADGDYDHFAWPVNVSNGGVGNHPGNYYYEKIFGKEVEDAVKKAGVKVQKRLGPERGKDGGLVDWRFIEMTPEAQALIKKGFKIWMLPFLLGTAGAAGGARGLLSRKISDEEA